MLKKCAQTLYECGGEWVEADKLNKEVLHRYAQSLAERELASASKRACSLCGDEEHLSAECDEALPVKDKGEADDEDYDEPKGGGVRVGDSENLNDSSSSSSSVSLESEEEEARPRRRRGTATAAAKRGRGKRARADRGEPDARTLLSQKGQKDKRRDHTVVPRGTALQQLLADSRIETLVSGTLARVAFEPRGDPEAVRALVAAVERGRAGAGPEAPEGEEEEEDEEEDAGALVQRRRHKERRHRQARKRHEQRQQQAKEEEEEQEEEEEEAGDGYEDAFDI